MPSFLNKYWKYFLSNIYLQLVVFLFIEWIAFNKVFSFWFFHGWEAGWLLGTTGGKYTLRTLMQSHGFISFINLKLFGWRPAGWFATAFILHFLTTCFLVLSIRKITKNYFIAFLSGLLFIATTADHDVITWGSFESLYAAQTLGFYIVFLCFVLYRQTQNKLWYIFSLIAFFISLILRESGIIFIPLLFLLDVLFYHTNLLISLFHKKMPNIDKIKNLLKTQIPFWIMGILYLLLRMSYGGSPNDFIDQRVQFRILLMHEHRYIEYFWWGILAFGQYIPPYFIPYPILNSLKDSFVNYFHASFLNVYFFVFLGWIFYLSMIIILWLQRKTKFFVYLIFLISMFTIITLFYSYTWTIDATFLATPYSWSENRWRYFAFSSFSVFIVISVYQCLLFSQKYFKKNYIFSFGMILYIVASIIVNIFYLRRIENDMYWQNSYPSIQFYKTFTKNFPLVTSKDKFYYYRNSAASLNDFLAEFYYIKTSFYPTLRYLPQDWVRSQMYFLVKYLQNGTLPPKDIHFIDYISSAVGVVDISAQVFSYLNKQKNIVLNPTVTDNYTYNAKVTGIPPVEFPYNVMLHIALSPTQNMQNQIAHVSNEKFNALLSFIPDEVAFIAHTKVTVCKTMDNIINEEFHNYRKENIIDGNTQDRSRWWADCRPAWVTFDLGKEENIAGFGWGSYNLDDFVPRDYTYQISSDGNNWQTVLEINKNENSNRLDKLSHTVAARYVRFYVRETKKRGMLSLNEFTVIPDSAKEVFHTYTNYHDLFSDMYQFWYKLTDEQFALVKNFQTKFAWIPVTWETNPTNLITKEQRTYYIPVNADGIIHSYSFEIPESELYSGNDQFLNRFISKIFLVSPFMPEDTNIQNMSLQPIFPSKNNTNQ